MAVVGLLVAAGVAGAGERIVYTNRGQDDLYVTDRGNLSTSRHLASDAFNGALSSDGSQVLYTDHPYYTQSTRIVLKDVDGTGSSAPFQSPFLAGLFLSAVNHPRFSPDGQWILYSYWPDWSDSNPYDWNPPTSVGEAAIWRMRRDGTQREEVLDWPGDQQWASYSPDGSKITFISTQTPQGEDLTTSSSIDPNGQLFVADADGTDPVQLTPAPSDEGFYFDRVGDPTFSPDGSTIAFQGDDSNCCGYEHVWTIPAGGGAATQVSGRVGFDPECSATADGGRHPSWRPDGAKILYLAENCGRHLLEAAPDGTQRAIVWNPHQGSGVNYRRLARYRPQSYGALLARYSPILKYDEQERFFAHGVAPFVEWWRGVRTGGSWSEDFATALVHGGNIAALAGAPTGWDDPPLTIDTLGAEYPSGTGSSSDDEVSGPFTADGRSGRIADTEDKQTWAVERGEANRVHGRAVHDSTGRLWLQYWLFYYLNDQNVAEVGTHEGDWEPIAIRLKADLSEPDWVVFGAHNTESQKCEWDAVEKEPLGGSSPYVYPANAGHGNYPYAGVNTRGTAPDDEHRGGGPTLKPALVSIGDDSPGWIAWPGRWGGTDDVVSPSPVAPREQDRWARPEDWFADARACDEEPPSALGRSGARSPRTGAPDAPQLRARLRGRTIVASYTVGRARARITGAHPYTILITAHNADGSGIPTGNDYRVKSHRARHVLGLPRGGGPYVVKASVFTREGVRSEIITTPVR